MIPGWAKDVRFEDIQHEGMLELDELIGLEGMF